MRKILLAFLVAFTLLFAGNGAYANEKDLKSDVIGGSYSTDYSSNNSSVYGSKRIKAFDRLILRLNDLFELAKNFIYFMTVFVLMTYIFDWIKKGDVGLPEFQKLIWLMVALAILGTAKDFARLAVGGDVKFITDVEQTYNVKIMENSLK